jgi:ankyrin repeat protein
LPDYDADAYSTGEALFALHEAGLPASDRAVQNGLKFLLSTQSREGVWRVRTRMLSPAEVSPTYFPTGFPFGKDEFLSYAGSCWAVMALLSALPDVASPAGPGAVEPITDAAPAWVRTALFGSTGELTRLLDGGLSPNSATSNGSSLLMLAAPDAEKVRLLVSRGAEVKVRSKNGTDALTIASAYRDTAASLRLLLDAGADAETPESVHAPHAPLVFASMTGDIENVRLLLSRGAKPASEALSEAVTFGYPDVVRTLIDSGTDATVTAHLGINLIHWATIANRFDVIPVLAAAHVPVDDTDDFGFTPLMYAATIDHGSIKTVQSLLIAGADRRIRNDHGRTAYDQANQYKHNRLATAVR